MDCKTFRHRLLIDPNDPDPNFRAHARGCPDCALAATRALAFEAQLRGVLHETFPPDARPQRDRGPGTTAPLARRWVWAGAALLLGSLLWWLLT